MTKSDARVSRQTGQLWGWSAQISQKGRLESSSTRSSFPAIIPSPFPWLSSRWMVDGGSGNLVSLFTRVINQMARHVAALSTIAAAVHLCLVESHHVDIHSIGQEVT